MYDNLAALEAAMRPLRAIETALAPVRAVERALAPVRTIERAMRPYRGIVDAVERGALTDVATLAHVHESPLSQAIKAMSEPVAGDYLAAVQAAREATGHSSYLDQIRAAQKVSDQVQPMLDILRRQKEITDLFARL